MSRKIIFTGGGSAGHVTLNLALIPLFLKQGWNVAYIGSHKGIEKDLVAKFPEVKYYSIATGKLRRYFSWQNFLDMLKIPLGVLEAVWIVFRFKPDLIFSKGGFVSFPVVLAGKINGRPVVMHESDVTPGLANKMSLPFVTRFFTTFEDTSQYVKEKSKIDCVGPVLTDRFVNGSKDRACAFCAFDPEKPVILVVGGSLGAKNLNEAIRRNLKLILQKYQIIHICGRGLTLPEMDQTGYRQYEYVDQELKDFMEAADVVISRAGSNAIFELLSLAKPMIMVPLSAGSSRGEQMLNARSFQRKGYGEVIADDDLCLDEKFLELIDQVYENRLTYRDNMKKSSFKSTDNVQMASKLMEIAGCGSK